MSLSNDQNFHVYSIIAFLGVKSSAKDCPAISFSHLVAESRVSSGNSKLIGLIHFKPLHRSLIDSRRLQYARQMAPATVNMHETLRPHHDGCQVLCMLQNQEDRRMTNLTHVHMNTIDISTYNYLKSKPKAR